MAIGSVLQNDPEAGEPEPSPIQEPTSERLTTAVQPIKTPAQHARLEKMVALNEKFNALLGHGQPR